MSHHCKNVLATTATNTVTNTQEF